MEETQKKDYRFLKGILAGFFIGVITVAACFLVLFAVKTIRHRTSESEVVTDETIRKIDSIRKMIDKYLYPYDEKITTENLEEGIYRGMVESLNDPYSEYFSAEELNEEINDIKGVSYGIGVVVTLENDRDLPMITSVMAGSPAEEAGVLVGDIIYEVEGESMEGLSLSEVVSRVKGQEGTMVHITFLRDEKDLVEMDVVRGKLIENTTVVYGMIEDEGAEGIGYINISEFDDATTDQFAEALAELKAKGMKALILDLRYNFGGSMNASVEIARKILPEGMVVYTEDKNGKRTEYTCDGKHELDVPLVVLVNQYTASASEILSGAIKDHNKGTLVGTTTYGKGIVQRIISLDDDSALKLTISAYYTPSGHNIQGTGIEPDVEMELDRDLYDKTGQDTQLEKGIEILKQKLGE